LRRFAGQRKGVTLREIMPLSDSGCGTFRGSCSGRSVGEGVGRMWREHVASPRRSSASFITIGNVHKLSCEFAASAHNQYPEYGGLLVPLDGSQDKLSAPIHPADATISFGSYVRPVYISGTLVLPHLTLVKRWTVCKYGTAIQSELENVTSNTRR
jgi:hypothetical protein